MQQDRLLTRSRAASAIIACSFQSTGPVMRATSWRMRVCVLIERRNSVKQPSTFNERGEGKKRKREKKDQQLDSCRRRRPLIAIYYSRITLVILIYRLFRSCQRSANQTTLVWFDLQSITARVFRLIERVVDYKIIRLSQDR